MLQAVSEKTGSGTERDTQGRVELLGGVDDLPQVGLTSVFSHMIDDEDVARINIPPPHPCCGTRHLRSSAA